MSWSEALDHPGLVDSRIQQTTVNILKQFTAVTPPSQLPAPSGLTPSVVSDQEVDLTWTDNSTNEDNFVLERSADSLFSAITSFVLPANTTAYPDTPLPLNTYYYRVKARNTTDVSAYSNTAVAVMRPTAPTGLTVTGVSGSKLILD